MFKNSALPGTNSGRIALFVVGVLAVQVFPVVFHYPGPGHFGQQLFQRLPFHFGQLHQLLGGLGLAHAHLQGDLHHLIGHHAGQAPVFGVIGRGLQPYAVGNHAAQLEEVLARVLITGILKTVYSHPEGNWWVCCR